jgi:hypothetical protein
MLNYTFSQPNPSKTMQSFSGSKLYEFDIYIDGKHLLKAKLNDDKCSS